MENENNCKRVYRSENEKLIAGVCGGLGDYFNIDPVILRLAMVLIALFSFGTMAVAYVIAWIVIPRKPEYRQR